MKAISLHQPWASLIALGYKIIETRSWKPPAWLIGQRIAIHAAKRKMRPDEDGWGYSDKIYLRDKGLPVVESVTIGSLVDSFHWGASNPCPLGMVVATAVLTKAVQVECVANDRAYYIDGDGPLRTLESVPTDIYGDFSPGRWLWFLEDVERLPEPIAAVGHQGFWNWEG